MKLNNNNNNETNSLKSAYRVVKSAGAVGIVIFGESSVAANSLAAKSNGLRSTLMLILHSL